MTNEQRDALLGRARASYQREGEVEVDDNAEISECDDGTCWVQAWVWLPANEEDD